MEALLGGIAAKGSTLHKETEIRLKTRPEPREGTTFQDFGTTQWTTPSSRPSRNHQVKTIYSEDADSDDEMDCFSGSNASHYDSDTRHNSKKSTSRRDRITPTSIPSPPRRSGARATRGKATNAKGTPSVLTEKSNAAPQQTQRPRPKPRPVKPPPSTSRNISGSDDDVYPPLRLVTATQTKQPSSSTIQAKEFPTISPLRGDTGGNTPPTIKTTRSKAVKARSAMDRRTSKSPTLSSGVSPRSLNNGVTSSDSDPDNDEIGLRSDDEPLTRGGLRPFPMDASLLQSIDASPLFTPKASKSGPANAVFGRNKKSTQKNLLPLRNFPMTEEMFQDISSTPPTSQPKYSWMNSGDEMDEEESMSPVADPKTLCPFCDVPLPSSPTPTLMALIARATEHKSCFLEPRPGNRRGRRAPVQVFAGVCQRHRFESEILPEAERMGWPKSIEWGKIRDRVKRMEVPLQAIIQDIDDLEKHGSQSAGGPRTTCIFWQEVLKVIKSTGSRGLIGVRGQYSIFDKLQPGYYGELGSVIIHQTLYDLFPPHKIDPTFTAPLTPDDFIRLILVPEVGLRLIMEDRGLSSDLGIAEGVKILRASAKYGVAMFPEDGGEWGEGASGRKGNRTRKEEMGAADVILMERAIRRRRELALEEGDEEAEEMLLRKAVRKERKSRGSDGTKGRKRRLGKVKGSEMETSDVPEVAKPTPLPRPRPVRILNPLTGSPPTSSHEQSKPTDGTASSAEIGERCTATLQSKSQQPIGSSKMRYGTPIELDSSDSVEGTDSSYSDASPSKRRRTKAKGKLKDATPKIDAGDHFNENFLHPTRRIDPDMTPRRLLAKFTTEPASTLGPLTNNIPGPSDMNFYPLKAARARKCTDSTSDGWKFHMSASEDDSTSKSSGSPNNNKSRCTNAPLLLDESDELV